MAGPDGYLFWLNVDFMRLNSLVATSVLTHAPMCKMAAISQMVVHNLIKILLKFVSKGPIDKITQYWFWYGLVPNVKKIICRQRWTRTTRMPTFWDTPTAPWLHILVIRIRSQVKTRQSQSYKFKRIAKNSNFGILQETLHVTHLIKLLDKMYKYEMDPTRSVGATERTRDVGQTDGRTDGLIDVVKPIYIHPNNLWGFNKG